ncbi:hypothetical protein NHQ30_007707 [Ciborinia camelliae]|nr:hypothetical protein NHQ30_007707 [Ciborinia camelliae]
MGRHGHHHHRNNDALAQAIQDIAATKNLSPTIPPPDLFNEVEKAEASTKRARERYSSYSNKADENLTRFLKARLLLPMISKDLPAFWTAAANSREEVKRAREDYFVCCRCEQIAREKLRKNTLDFFLKEMNSLGAVVRKLQHEDVSRRQREKPTRGFWPF